MTSDGRPTDAELTRPRPGVPVGRTEPAPGHRREIVFYPATGRLLRLRETVVDPIVAFGGSTCGAGSAA